MERKHLKMMWYDVVLQQTGVGATSSVGVRLVNFGINARAREVMYLKTMRLQYGIYEAGAGTATLLRSVLARRLLVVEEESRQNTSANVMVLERYDSDSYAQYAGSSRGDVVENNWEFQEGFEPAFLDAPYMSNYLRGYLGAGLHAMALNWVFWFWIEQLPEREYEKLKLEYGTLG